jgi:hypothetical protein
VLSHELRRTFAATRGQKAFQFYETLMPRNPVPRFRRGPEATHCGRISTGYDDLNAERPIFQRNGTIGCPGVRVCHSHADRKPGVKGSLTDMVQVIKKREDRRSGALIIG